MCGILLVFCRRLHPRSGIEPAEFKQIEYSGKDETHFVEFAIDWPESCTFPGRPQRRCFNAAQSSENCAEELLVEGEYSEDSLSSVLRIRCESCAECRGHKRCTPEGSSFVGAVSLSLSFPGGE